MRFNPRSKKPTKLESAHMAHIKQMGCVRCGQFNVDCHHIVEASRRLGNMHCLPLCKAHHRNIYELTFQEQMELCRELYKKHSWEFIEPPTKVIARKLWTMDNE